jgi:DMSO/TMAO reductase YedYZ molybdopterin-dependent catalytic subunit
LLGGLPRVEQVSDFHCVTTWSVRAVRWGGVRFADFHRLVLREARPADDARFVVLRGADGYRSILLLEDLLHDDVLLADTLEGEPLPIQHGAPLRLVAPAHYGYKNVKHLMAIDYLRDRRRYRFPLPYPALMDHPRGRVALEERACVLPGRLARILYRPLIAMTVRNFRRALTDRSARR